MYRENQTHFFLSLAVILAVLIHCVMFVCLFVCLLQLAANAAKLVQARENGADDAELAQFQSDASKLRHQSLQLQVKANAQALKEVQAQAKSAMAAAIKKAAKATRAARKVHSLLFFKSNIGCVYTI